MKPITALGLAVIYILFGPIAFILMLCDNRDTLLKNNQEQDD